MGKIGETKLTKSDGFLSEIEEGEKILLLINRLLSLIKIDWFNPRLVTRRLFLFIYHKYVKFDREVVMEDQFIFCEIMNCNANDYFAVKITF